MRRVALVVALSVLASCGIPIDGSPRPIPEADRSRTIGQSQPPTGGTAPTGSPVIFLVDSAAVPQLVAVRRDVAAEPRSVLDALIKGPTKSDLDDNRTSSLPPGVLVVDVTRSGPTTVTVDLRQDADSSGFLVTPAGVLGLAQLVFTATSLSCVTSVRIAINGEARPLFDELGNRKTGPLTRADFASKRPPFSATDARRDTSSCT